MRTIFGCGLLVMLTACLGPTKLADTVDSRTSQDSVPTVVDADGDGAPEEEDCDDNDADVYPGQVELCDGLDNNCDGQVDEGATATYYRDSDGDGYGDPEHTQEACDQPSGYVSDNTDCDDGDVRFNPGASELDCSDPSDYNCDGSVGYVDNDGDGFAACEECNDRNADINPSAQEECDEIDNDCDSTVDEGVSTTYYADTDGDGYGDEDFSTQDCDTPAGYVDNAEDCDDSDATVNPDGFDGSVDGIDQDCDNSDAPATLYVGDRAGELFAVDVSGTPGLVTATSVYQTGIGIRGVAFDGLQTIWMTHDDETISSYDLESGFNGFVSPGIGSIKRAGWDRYNSVLLLSHDTIGSSGVDPAVYAYDPATGTLSVLCDMAGGLESPQHAIALSSSTYAIADAAQDAILQCDTSSGTPGVVTTLMSIYDPIGVAELNVSVYGASRLGETVLDASGTTLFEDTLGGFNAINGMCSSTAVGAVFIFDSSETDPSVVTGWGFTPGSTMYNTGTVPWTIDGTAGPKHGDVNEG